MARAVEKIEEEIRALPPAEQERLLRTLLEELGGHADPDVERFWLAEVRGQAMLVNKVLINGRKP